MAQQTEFAAFAFIDRPGDMRCTGNRLDRVFDGRDNLLGGLKPIAEQRLLHQGPKNALLGLEDRIDGRARYARLVGDLRDSDGVDSALAEEFPGGGEDTGPRFDGPLCSRGGGIDRLAAFDFFIIVNYI